MQRAVDQFRSNITYVRDLGAMYRALRAQTTKAIDLSAILRAELVMAVSALDHYVHEIVRIGMLEIHNGVRVDTPSFLQFDVSLKSARSGIISPANCDWLENEIRLRHGWRSFQTADKIADAIRLISPVQLWQEVANELNSQPEDVKLRLKLIVDRRNQIAHEADMGPTAPGFRWPIDEVSVDSSVDFLEQVAEVIYRVVV